MSVLINPAVAVCSLRQQVSAYFVSVCSIYGVDLTIIMHSYGVNVTFNFLTHNNEIAKCSYYP